jgi:hypothetical protein
MRYRDAVLASRPYGYWPLDDSTSVVRDITRRGHDGTWNSGWPSRSGPLLPGAAPRSMSASSSASQPGQIPASTLTNTQAKTIVVLVNTIPLDEQMLASRDPRSDSRLVQFSVTGGVARSIDFDVNGDIIDVPTTGTKSLVDGRTHQVAYVHDNPYTRLYVDGTLDAQQNVGSVRTSSGYNAPIYLGWLPSLSSGLQGRMSDVAYYDRALTGAEIKALWQALAPTPHRRRLR